MSSPYWAGAFFTWGFCWGVDDGKEPLVAFALILLVGLSWPLFWVGAFVYARFFDRDVKV